MILECYATPITQTKYNGRTEANLRLIDLTNTRIRPDHKSEDEFGAMPYCILFRDGDKQMRIFETYETIRNRIKNAVIAGSEVAFIGDHEYAS